VAQDEKAKSAGRGARGTSDTTRHSWAVDSLGEGTASIEHDGDRVFHVPRSLLPTEAREGDVLDVRVTTSTEGGRQIVTVNVRVDPKATDKSTDASARQVDRIRRGNDPGGDVRL
jgi:hypothetical protein